MGDFVLKVRKWRAYIVVGFERSEAGLEGVVELFFGPELSGVATLNELLVEVLEWLLEDEADFGGEGEVKEGDNVGGGEELARLENIEELLRGDDLLAANKFGDFVLAIIEEQVGRFVLQEEAVGVFL